VDLRPSSGPCIYGDLCSFTVTRGWPPVKSEPLATAELRREREGTVREICCFSPLHDRVTACPRVWWGVPSGNGSSNMIGLRREGGWGLGAIGGRPPSLPANEPAIDCRESQNPGKSVYKNTHQTSRSRWNWASKAMVRRGEARA
jgi:hypothetical protein